MFRTSLASVVLVLAACGGDKKEGPGKGSGGAGGGAAAAAPLTVPPLGVDAVKRFNYVYGPAQKEYDKVIAAYKATPRDWAAIKTAAEATLAKDPDHLDARWALGEALANTADPAHAAESLLAAVAGDWLRWGPGLDKDPDLATFLTTPQGKALLDASATLRKQVEDALAKDPLVLGRRSGWKLPKPGAAAYAATRGELYAYDVDQKRFLRITHTDHTVAAALRAPSGELLLAGYTQAQVPDPAAGPAAPILTRSWVSAWDPKQMTVSSAQAAVPKGRFVWAGYGPGEQVVVMTATAQGRWSPGTFTSYVVDRATGKLTKSAGATAAGPHIQMSLDDVAIVADAPGWPAGLDPAVVEKFAAVASVPGKGQDLGSDIPAPPLHTATLSPGGTRIAFATATDPCKDQSEAAQPSLYVADAKTGDYKHVLTAASRFRVEWIDDDRLLYEDGTGTIRVYDAAAHRELGKLGERAGLALETLPPSAAPLCQTEPPADDPTAVDELPAEETADPGAGPATTP